MGRPNLFGMGKRSLAGLVADRGEPAFRGRQLYGWLYERRVRDVSAMSDLPQSLRASLAADFELRWPEVQERTLSFDGTRKYLFRLDDGASVEAVYIPEDARRTICISTQAGCPLKCAFCLTGIAGYKRNLKPWEILGQVATVMDEHPVAATHPDRRADDPFPWNVVMMGMGEPLLNYDATLEALRVLMDEDGFGVPPRKLTLSTVGILPALAKLAQRAGAPQPRDQPACSRSRTAAGADADRGEVSVRRRGRRGAALRGPARRPRHLRVRAARRRERLGRRTRASSPAGWAAGASR